ncbi:aKG-HExxH-type peptide beta-hydroxylase [Actinoplanes auranticolor]|uniref:HEXXH motif-containing protein n=1 Tax=Actinoplanes auranticolor TaxID=47988 RepID=A0A919SF93_9ACTN|nr:HEXXH motif-containing putative peptide modification protein [Actinoplanes auranticolor]GIM69968.1 hypothetical protein Aau02nite_38790 [Actinoplanes auranticolor]
MQEYVLTREQLRDLARGHGDPQAMALLVDSQLSRRRLYLLAIAESSAGRPGLRDALALVARIDRDDPAAGRRLLRHPFLDAWFAEAARDASPAGDTAGGYLGALAVATAVSAGLPCHLVVDTGPDLVLPGLGTATAVGPGRCEVRFDGAVLSIGGSLRLRPGSTGSAPGWRPALRVVVPGHTIEIIDTDPLRDRFPQPPLPPLSPAEGAAYGRVIADAWHLLEYEQPRHAEAMRLALHAVVPLRTPADGRQVSASVRGTFGAVGLSPPPAASTAAELLVHEFQHDKMSAVLDLVDLCADGGPARFHAPWRPDPRPAAALVQGCYAFAGVAGFWEEHRRHLRGEARRRAEYLFASWREHVGYALAQLRRSGELTAEGAWFFAELGEVVDSWRDESPAIAAARRSAEATHVAWRLACHRPRRPDVADLADAWQRGAAPRPAGPPEMVATPAEPPLALARALTETWLDGRPPAGLTGAEWAVAGEEYGKAIRLLAAPASDRDWTALAVALHATGVRAAYERPDLLRALWELLAERRQAAPPGQLARWLPEGPSEGSG